MDFAAWVQWEMVNTGQGLVLGATTGSRPELLLAAGLSSGAVFLFAAHWTLLWDCGGSRGPLVDWAGEAGSSAGG